MKRLLLLALAMLPLSGCASLMGAKTLDFDCSTQQLSPYMVGYAEPRVISQIHRDVGEDISQTLAQERLTESSKSPEMPVALDPIYQSLLSEKEGFLESSKREPKRLLMLSGGGQWGAFGAGLLNTLAESDKHRLPRFDVVTGVSTGAIQALFVTAGKLPELEKQYTSDAELAVHHNELYAVLHGFQNDTAPLRRRLEARLCNTADCDMLEEIGKSKTDVFIGMVESRTGDFKVVDIGKMIRKAASETDKQAALRRTARCVAAVTMASAAVPVQLRPVRLTSGGSAPQTYADGGVRLSVFEANIARIAEAAQNDRREVQLFVLRNGPTVVMPNHDKPPTASAPVDRKPSAKELGMMAYATLVNQNEVMSIAALRLLHPQGKIYVATADGYATPYVNPGHAKRTSPQCFRDDKLAFEHQFMVCLSAWGREKASQPESPWIDLAPITFRKSKAGGQ